MRVTQRLRQRGDDGEGRESRDLADSGVFDEPTIDCYRRRREIVTNAHRTEWWMAVGVLVIIASVGLVIL